MSYLKEMSTSSNKENGNFNVSLPEWDKPYTLPKLLRHAMKILKETGPQRPYIHELSVLDADHPYEGTATLSVSYWNKDKDTLAFERERFEFRREHKVALPTKDVTCFPVESAISSLHMLEYRLPQNDSQADTILLVESLADYLEKNKIETICDLILHNQLDDDALDHPFIRVYYTDN